VIILECFDPETIPHALTRPRTSLSRGGCMHSPSHPPPSHYKRAEWSVSLRWSPPLKINLSRFSAPQLTRILQSHFRNRKVCRRCRAGKSRAPHFDLISSSQGCADFGFSSREMRMDCCGPRLWVFGVWRERARLSSLLSLSAEMQLFWPWSRWLDAIPHTSSSTLAQHVDGFSPWCVHFYTRRLVQHSLKSLKCVFLSLS